MPKTNKNVPERNPTGHISQPAGTFPSAWRPSLLGAVPLPAFIGMIVVLNFVLPSSAQLGAGLRFEPPLLNAILYTVFISFTSFLVAYISLKSYLQNGLAILLLLGSAALAWGSTALVGSWLTNYTSGPNVGITIINTGSLFAAIFHVASGALTSTSTSPQNGSGLRRSLSFFAYGGVFFSTALLTILSLEGLVPPFFVPGVGQTPLRMAVLGSAVALFAVSSFLFARLYFSSNSGTLYWYFLALGLASVGLAAVFFGRAPGDPIAWTGRSAMFLGGAYFLKAVLTTFRGVHSGGAQ